MPATVCLARNKPKESFECGPPKLMDALGLELPIIQAPMAGANGSAMAPAVCEASGGGSKGFRRFYLAVVGASGCPSAGRCRRAT